jgi:hypothetical protein
MRHLLYRCTYPLEIHFDGDTLATIVHLGSEARGKRRHLLNQSRLSDPFAGLDLGLNAYKTNKNLTGG